MTPKTILSRPFACAGGLPAMAIVLALGSVAFAQSKQSADRVREIDRMIDAMASRNKAPRMVSGFNSGFYTSAPLVARDYDWPEQDRVRKAVLAVRKDKSDEMWWRLRGRITDRRYALTVVFDDVHDPTNVDVGEFCSDITDANLIEAYARHLPEVSGRMPSELYPAAVVEKNEKKWAGRPLFELQIEVCEEAIRQFAGLKATAYVGFTDYRHEGKSHAFTAEEKAGFTAAVRKQIEELKRTKMPVTPDKAPLRGIDPHYGPWGALDARTASEVRDAYEKEKGGQGKDEKGKRDTPR
jgi:hypothetical protein